MQDFGQFSARFDVTTPVTTAQRRPSRFRLHAPNWNLEETRKRTYKAEGALLHAQSLSDYGMDESEILADLMLTFPDLGVTKVHVVLSASASTMWLETLQTSSRRHPD